MRWSWKIATFRGISVYIHATFLLIIGWILMIHIMQGHTLWTALGGVVFILLLFLCVVLHEFGHALTAQRYGISTRDITLYPIGGVARLERIPRNPTQELVIALAGPAVNVVIFLVLALFLLAARAFTMPDRLQLVGGNLFANLMWINLILVVFNMLPAFPMDGGRVLRALLAQRMEYGQATQIAATIGQAMAFLFGFWGLLWNPFLLFIAFFVYIGATQEAAVVQTELAFRNVPVRDAMMTRFRALSAQEPLAAAADQLLDGAQQDFPVVEEDRVIGLLTRRALIEALSKQGPSAPIAEAMQPAPPPVSPTDSLETTFQRMRELEVQAVPVMIDSRLVGLVTLENIGEYLMIKTALEGTRAGDGRAASEQLAAEAEGEAARAGLRRYLWGRRARG
jgi:Zn-dependent protease